MNAVAPDAERPRGAVRELFGLKNRCGRVYHRLIAAELSYSPLAKRACLHQARPQCRPTCDQMKGPRAMAPGLFSDNFNIFNMLFEWSF
jgi:hypothetical protein